MFCYLRESGKVNNNFEPSNLQTKILSWFASLSFSVIDR